MIFLSIFWICGLIGTFAAISDAVRRMSSIQKEFPLLRKSEKFAYVLYSTLIIFFVLIFVSVTLTIEISQQHPNIKPKRALKIYFIADLLASLLTSAIIVLIAYMMLKLNKPLMSRKDLSSGQEVSMLMFIKSKRQLRKIFDTDTDRDTFINQSHELQNQD